MDNSDNDINNMSDINDINTHSTTSSENNNIPTDLELSDFDLNDLETNDTNKSNHSHTTPMGNCVSSRTESVKAGDISENEINNDNNMSDNESDVIDESIFIEQIKKGKRNNKNTDKNLSKSKSSTNPEEKRGFFSTLYKKHEKNNIQQQINSLDIMIEALYDAVSKAQRNIRMNNINELDYYFPYNEEEDVREPKTMSIKLPSKTDNGFDIIEVPIYSLVNHTPLDINEFNIKFKANMCSAKKVKDNYDSNPHVRHKKYMISTDVTGNGKNVAEIELKCKITEPPEGLSRLSEVLEKVI